MNTKSKRTNGIKVTPDEKREMVDLIVQKKLEGISFNAISKELQCTYETTKRYWDEYVLAQGDVDCSQLLRERRLLTNRILEKTIRLFYADAIDIKAVETAMNLTDRYNGLTQHLATAIVEQLPPLLELKIIPVVVEMPPVNE
jgi:hypothetical protein